MERPDLPDGVIALSRRLLGDHGASVTGVRFAQTGVLRTAKEARWMPFKAEQWTLARRPSFSWHAKTGPLGSLRIVDSLEDKIPTGRVSLFGLIALSKAKPDASLLKGQLMRYLAELPWCPFAIICNPLLRWKTLSDECIEVSASIGEVTGSITIWLDTAGLPTRVSGLRPRKEGDHFREREWIGHFDDFRQICGALVPHSGRVGWAEDGTYSEVWRGSIEEWALMKKK